MTQVLGLFLIRLLVGLLGNMIPRSKFKLAELMRDSGRTLSCNSGPLPRLVTILRQGRNIVQVVWQRTDCIITASLALLSPEYGDMP